MRWVALRRRDQGWLEPWEATPPEAATVPWAQRQSRASWVATRRALRRAERHGEAAPYALLVDGRFAGQVTLAPVVGGASRSAAVGYWLEHGLAGRGLGTRAVALVVQEALGPMRLHRVEAWVRPDNARSRALLARLGFAEEGLAREVLWADGRWRDHLLCALRADQVPAAGLLSLLRDTPARLPEERPGPA